MKRGFTLIELLVVIAIIGVLSSVVLASLNAARVRATETKKKAELRELSLALNHYYLDNNTVPATTGCCWVPADTVLSSLVPTYISRIPTSPDGQPYYYYDYGSFVLVANYMNDTYGPGSQGWHCSDAAGGTTGSKYWCIEFTK